MREESPDKFSVLGNVKTVKGARTMECDTSTHTLYSVTADFGPPPPPDPNNPNAGAGGRFRRGPMIAGSLQTVSHSESLTPTRAGPDKRDNQPFPASVRLRELHVHLGLSLRRWELTLPN